MRRPLVAKSIRSSPILTARRKRHRLTDTLMQPSLGGLASAGSLDPECRHS
jgi:hypothetical protein